MFYCTLTYHIHTATECVLYISSCVLLHTGCYDFNGQFILEGEWWHPTLPEYGVVECVNCTCQV